MIENTFGINIVPENEAHRLDALKRYRITDTPSEESFDGIARLAAQIFNTPVSLLSLVDAESVFFKANIGMGKATRTNRGKSLCALAVMDEKLTVFEDALKEPCLIANPNVTGDFGLRFYAGAPLITHDGFSIGTLCIIDQKSRIFSDADRLILEGLAKTAMDHIELRRSSLDTIDEVRQVNIQLNATRKNLEDAVHELAEFNMEMEATNDELNKVNNELSKSYDLTVSLNASLKNSEQRLKSFISHAPVAFGILTGRELMIEVANDMILKIWGKTGSIIGMPLVNALPELEGQPYLNILDNVFTTGSSYVCDTTHVRLDSEGVINDCYFDFIYEPLKNELGESVAIIVIGNEVTDRINKRKKLEELNQHLKIALHAGRLGSYNLNLKTGIMSCSEICKANYGFANEDPFNFDDLMNSILPEYREYVKKEIDNSIKNALPYHAEYMIKWPDGSLHWMSASGLPGYDHEGNPAHMNGVTIDITKRKNYEAQKDDFLGIASHELKTPITSLKATIQLLTRLKGNLGHEMVPRLIDQASGSMKKLNALVDDLLNMHRISEGQLELKKEVFNVSRMLDNCCNDIRFIGKYNLIIEGDREASVFADESRIEQVVVNLVNNAIKYAPDSRDIYLSTETLDNGQIRISVKDNGDGIDPAVQPFIFDRYYRANHQGKKYSGLGLGLYISSEIIRRHEGDIGVESSLGKGSRFWFTLPAKEKV
ncbi:ATP-binding protein [Chryseobacterium sp. JJR-5R]|uniref:ATP-binding protein n=1 Tax=Chryseobacterium sp. JJR-5R TaxID=3093923 RepID=UPI002A74B094|nr:ATP-binding protein [Chryseobacterium sp. JJR-5R]WPO81386.1 ATP-binding protein [Chryseobacterium sp. JJR-5R]